MYDIYNARHKELRRRTEEAMLTVTKDIPVNPVRADGCWLIDDNGRTFLDMFSGVGVAALGHNHPRLVEQEAEMRKDYIPEIAAPDMYSEADLLLAERLNELAPGPTQKRTMFVRSGTEALEAAAKLVVDNYPKPEGAFLVFANAFHGRTAGSLSFTQSKPVHKKGFAWAYDTVTFEFPHEDLKADGLSLAEEELVRFIERSAPHKINALVFEPVQGEGGIYPISVPSIQRIYAALQEKHIPVIADEVQTFARTGTLFASEWLGFEPDIICVAKAFGAGESLGAIIAKHPLNFTEPGRHSNTDGGKPRYAKKTLTLLDILSAPGFMEETVARSEYLRAGLALLAERHYPKIKQIRGRGLMLGIEMENRELRDRVIENLWSGGVLTIGAGTKVPVIRFLPPLIISYDELDFACNVLDNALVKS